MIISFEQGFNADEGEPYKRKFTLETSDDLDINEMMEEIKICLVAMTYHPESIKRYFEEGDEGIDLS